MFQFLSPHKPSTGPVSWFIWHVVLGVGMSVPLNLSALQDIKNMSVLKTEPKARSLLEKDVLPPLIVQEGTIS